MSSQCDSGHVTDYYIDKKFQKNREINDFRPEMIKSCIIYDKMTEMHKEGVSLIFDLPF